MEVDVVVRRFDGAQGAISCSFRTEDDTAKAGADYLPAAGDITFENGQMTFTLKLVVLSRGRYEGSDTFRLVLTDAAGKTFEKKATVLKININHCPSSKEKTDNIVALIAKDGEGPEGGCAAWKAQFTDAVAVNGGDDGEPHCMDYILHCLNLPWKLISALVPPPDILDAWPCFCCSLALMAGLTAILGDLASLFGCVLGVPDPITAITFVALGTSLPDTFASRTAAQHDEHADASVGNVTGSNSVNVFLGLGISWGIGSIYWVLNGPNEEWSLRYPVEAALWPDGIFVVPAGDLGFNVLIFCLCALSGISVIVARRRICGGELGGPRWLKVVSAMALVSLWCIYIALASYNSLRRCDYI
eukprot:gnl/TRDRNA2_/TRDRNA2_126443_c1_seq1.p1 gnl/TRDRNA2_/TRDRNA2_126443_c1~~gnl/TRDRNA2_/TRDRNA2_126443_c1_seq1.p1  ORF type:complete len:403 (+),score=67.01 gnl/TRDRNA2_/TRDRNA2_126443_c1_seq1:132-1211(+)